MKFLKIAAGLVVLWFAILVVLGLVYASRIESRVVTRVGEPLQATVTIGKTDLALIRGHLDLADVSVVRETGGHLGIAIGNIRCELPPLGGALLSSDCRTLAIQRMRVTVSAMGAFKLKGAQSPVHAKRVVIDDAILELSPSTLAPGLGKMTITVEHAEASDTVFKTPFSWIFALEALRAKVELPGGVEVTLGYDHGKLTVAGGLFGATPVTFPFTIPVAGLADDPKAELERLGKLGKEIGEQVLAQRAKDWIKSL